MEAVVDAFAAWGLIAAVLAVWLGLRRWLRVRGVRRAVQSWLAREPEDRLAEIDVESW